MSTGLGLAFCKLAVEAHGGHVGVKSTPGKGSIFYATMPLVQRVEPTIVHETPAVAIPPGAPLILVVEDDAGDRASIAAALRGAGYAVEAVATGAEALVRSREQRFSQRPR